MAHLRTDLYKCHRCCRLRDCGSNLKICQYTSKTDTCPAPTEGCPYYKVESEFDFDTETDKTCDIDQRLVIRAINLVDGNNVILKLILISDVVLSCLQQEILGRQKQ